MSSHSGNEPTKSGPVWLRNSRKAPAIRYRDFRFLWVSSLFSAIGMTGEQVVVSWFVLQLTSSPLMVGVVLGVRMAPFFLLGVFAGAIADRMNRRYMIALLNVGSAILNVVIGVLIILGLRELWPILLVTFIGGSLRALDQTARQSFAFDIVGQAGAVSGLAFVALSMRIGGIVGSLTAGGVMASQGVGVAYLVLGSAHALAVVLLAPIRSLGQSAPKNRLPVLQNLKEYLGEMGRNKNLLTLMFVTSAVEILGFSYQVLLPSLADQVLKVGAQGLGVLNAFRSVGGILGIIALSLFGEVRRKGLLFMLALHLFGGFLVLLAFVHSYVLSILVLTLVSGAAALSDVLSQSLMQLAVRNELRGRAMGSWVFAIGTAPIGHIQIGALAAAISVSFALTFNGAALFVLGVAAFIFLRSLRRL